MAGLRHPRIGWIPAALVGMALAQPVGGAQLQTGGARPVFEPNILETEFEWGDGSIKDFAAQYSHPAGDPQFMRIWAAGGRRRQTFRVSDRKRMLDEENQQLFAHTLQAVEVGPDDDVLYTATERLLQREVILPDGTLDPAVVDTWTLVQPFEGEIIRDVAVVGDPVEGEGVLVLTTQRLFAFSHEPSLPVGSRLVLREELAISPALKLMIQLRAHAGPDGSWRAYVMGVIDDPGFLGSKPVAKSLGVVDLDFPGTPGESFEGVAWMSPGEVWNPEDLDTQDAPDNKWLELELGPVSGSGFLPGEPVTSDQGAQATVQSVGPGHVTIIDTVLNWSGASSLQGITSSSTAPILAVVSYKGSSITNLDLENRGGQIYAFLAVGEQRQLTVLDVTSGSSGGFVNLGRWEFDSLTAGNAPTVSSVYSIPDMPNRLAVVLEYSVHLIDSTVLPTGAVDAVQVGPAATGVVLTKKVPKNEHALIRSAYPQGGDRFLLWTAGYSPEPYGHAIREFQLTDLGDIVPAGVRHLAGMYAFYATDGVDVIPGAVPRGTKLYMSNFSGVLPFQTADWSVPHTFEPLLEDFVVASSTGLDKGVHITEHLALATISPNDHRLLTDSATGVFLEYPLSGPDLHPNVPTEHTPPLSLFLELNSHYATGEEPNWSPQDPSYSNEIIAQKVEGKTYAIYDIANRDFSDPAHNQGAMVGIIARQLDPPPADDLEGWNMAIAYGPPITNEGKPITVCVDTNEDWAVAGFSQKSTPGGFAIFDLSGITGTDFDKFEATQVVSVEPYNGVPGIMMNPARTRIWVSLRPHEDSGLSGVAVYGFDEATGTVTNSGQPLARMSQHDGDFGPDYPLGPAFHLRLGPNLKGRERAFLGHGEGGIFELLYSPSAGMTLNGVWHSSYQFTGSPDEGYHGEITECRVYDLGYGPRVVVAKTTESFAIVRPSRRLAGQ